MKSENGAAWWWLVGWFYAIRDLEPIQAAKWERRLTWAYHRHARAMRMGVDQQGGCEFCGDPEHDESACSCPEREAAAAKWVMLGRRWSRKEAA